MSDTLPHALPAPGIERVRHELKRRDLVVTRQLRTHFLEDRGHAPGWLKAWGYWVQGTADAKENFD